MRITLLDIPIDAVKRHEALERIGQFLDEPRGHMVVTPNPEMLVDAQENEQFKNALQSADLAIPDGAGLLMMARLKGKRLPERVTGTDLMQDMLTLAEERGTKVYFVGGEKGVHEELVEKLKERYSNLQIVGSSDGGKLKRNEQGEIFSHPELIPHIHSVQPEMLFVAFGHAKQEEWMQKYLNELPSVRVAIGIGGAFDFMIGKSMRAPLWMQSLSIEWLWRLYKEPWRWKRIVKAVIVFPWLVITKKG